MNFAKGVLIMDMVIKYIKALVKLYGLVHKDKVVEIYNMQNEDKIDDQVMQKVIKEKEEYSLNEICISIHKNYFVYLPIMVGDYFEEELKYKKGKPFYIPEKEELLKYTDPNYFEVNKEYEELFNFVKKMFLFGRKSKADKICRKIQRYCKNFRAMENLHILFEEQNIKFKNTKQAEELMQLIRNLANNTRIWQNNGYTPKELEEMEEY